MESTIIKEEISISTQAISELQEYGDIVEVGKKDIVYSKGEFIKSIFIVLLGSVKLVRYSENGKELLVDLINKNEIIGISSLVRENYMDDAVALQNSVLLKINKNIFHSFLDQNESYKQMLTTSNVIKSIRYLERIEEVAFNDAAGRIKSFLGDLAERKGKKIGDQIIILHYLTNTDIANYTFCSRQTVSRVLNLLQNNKLIKIKRYKIILNKNLLNTKLFSGKKLMQLFNYSKNTIQL